MDGGSRHPVHNLADLLGALEAPGRTEVRIAGRIDNVPTITLRPGQALAGAEEGAALLFDENADGLVLTTDNAVRRIGLFASARQRAIANDTSVDTLGHMVIENVSTTGQVQIMARDKVRAGHVEVDGLDVIAADTLDRPDRPKGYGVEVYQGAFTLWNMQGEEGVDISARLCGLSAGRPGAPVLGSGIFVGGAGLEGGGWLRATLIETGAVYSDGRIETGTPDRITGGVFLIHGAQAETVRNRGPVTTYGANDMVLDNWGHAQRWIAEDRIVSHGPSGIGFVNFGVVDHLKVDAPIETFGLGARGFNVYTGTVELAEFDCVTTHADGAVGIQISRPIGRLHVRRGIETKGGTGQSLVKGVMMTLSAVPLSVKPGGAAKEIVVDGGIISHGAGVAPIEQHGAVETLIVKGGFAARGEGFEGI